MNVNMENKRSNIYTKEILMKISVGIILGTSLQDRESLGDSSGEH